MTLYLLNFKNYYNRQAIKYDTLQEYLDNASVLDIAYNYDFNPNDGIWSQVIVNSNYGNADYLLVTEDDEIVSRWYILESTRKRLAQYELKMLRDVIADNYNTVINTPTFIEKATVKYGNPLLFNSEDMTFNQIKTNEILLRDQTLCPWIVGYIKTATGSQNVTATKKGDYYVEVNSLEDIPLYSKIQNGSFSGDASINKLSVYYLWTVDLITGTKVDQVSFSSSGSHRLTQLTFGPFDNTYTGVRANREGRSHEELGTLVGNSYSTYYRNNKEIFDNAVYSELNIANPTETAQFLSTYTTEGTVYKVGSTFYKIKRTTEKPRTMQGHPSGTTSTLFGAFTDMVESNDYLVLDGPKVANFEATVHYTDFGVSITEVKNTASYSMQIPGEGQRNHLDDSPYDMFAIPYNIDTELELRDNNGIVISNCDATAAMNIASKISEKVGSANFIDIQLVPYCPIQNIIRLGGLVINNTQFTEDADYTYINDNSGTGDPVHVSIAFWCKSSSFSVNISQYYEKVGRWIVGSPISGLTEITEPKVQALCDMYRLSSPNYNGQFEFNAVKNEGVDYFKVDCTYKPFSPYIRVAPNFKGLYGGEYGDARGLICGGDFSLATTSDAWVDYQVNNKNYLNAFNRQIDNMEINNKYQRISEIAGATVGTISTGVTGGMTGAMLGGPVGAGIGAAAGGLASGIGGAIDVSINDKLRTEALDYTKDQFGYQLGNIRALPYSLSRVSAFNINNKIFPVLEYYTCTDVEKQALRDKIKYNGMTVQVIGTIAEYLQDEPSYVKGRIIRLEDLADDYHFAVAIAEEIYKGVFI